MKRVIQTSSFPVFPRSFDEDTEVIALGSAVPREFSVNPRSLSSIAKGILIRNGLAIVPAVRARYLLKRAIYRVAPGSDVDSQASRIKGILEIVLRTGIDAEMLVAKGSPRVKQLGSIAIEYRNSLRRNGFVDSSEKLLVASGLVAQKRKILVYGYFRARREEVLLIDALAGDGSVYYLPCGADPMFSVNNREAGDLVGMGWEYASQDIANSDGIGTRMAARFSGLTGSKFPIAASAFSDLDKEVRSTLASVKQLLRGGTEADKIAVITRDMKKYSRPISVTADEYGLPVQISHSISLETTGFGGFVTTLLEAIDTNFLFEPTARLVMHPFGPGLGEHKIADARRKRTTGLSQWLDLCPSLAGLDDKAERPLLAWAETIRSATEVLGSRKRAVGLTAEWLSYQGFFEALMATAFLEKDRLMTFEAFSSIVGEILKEESVPMRPRRGGVRLLLPEDMVGASFDHVFVMGMAEGIFPRPPREDPIVDFFERRALREYNVQFASASEVARWEELSFFFTLLAAQKQVILSYPRVLDNAELVPGAFFGKLGIQGEKLPVTREPDAISSLEEARRVMLRQPILSFDEGLESARRHYNAEFARETAPYYDEFDGVIGVPIDPAKRTWSASQITTIGQCSFRWFAGRLLRLSSVEEMKIGLDGATRGRLYHKALEIAVSRSVGSSDVRAATLDNLDQAFADAEKDEKVNLPTLPNWEVERREQLSELRKAVESPEFILPEAKVMGVEREFRAEWEGFPLRGTIDRIDDTDSGLIAIDYKTSGQVPKGAKDRNGKLSVDVQIPIYSRVALPQLYPGRQVGTSVYYSLTKGSILRAEQEADMARLGELAEFLHHILAKGSFAVDPDWQEKACTYCDFETVCRKGPRLKRKRRPE